MKRILHKEILQRQLLSTWTQTNTYSWETEMKCLDGMGEVSSVSGLVKRPGWETRGISAFLTRLL